MSYADAINERMRELVDWEDDPAFADPLDQPVQKLSAWVPIPLALLIDMGMATNEQIAQYEAAQALIPKPSRWRRLRWRLHEYRERALLARDALRGRHDCDQED